MTTIKSVNFDPSIIKGWTKDAEDAQGIAWMDDPADTNYLLLKQFFDHHCGLPIDDLAALRDSIRVYANERGGGLISCDLLEEKGVPLIRIVEKMPMQPHGMAYEGTLYVAGKDTTFIFRTVCLERGTTGARDNSVLAICFSQGVVQFDPKTKSMAGWTRDPYDPGGVYPSMPNLSEDERYDSQFPDHPLSRCRRLLRKLETSLQFDEEFLAEFKVKEEEEQESKFEIEQRQVEAELERRAEAERQRQARLDAEVELERKASAEREQEAEKERAERERQAAADVEQQAQAELVAAAELEAAAQLERLAAAQKDERQAAAELARKAELERQAGADLERAAAEREAAAEVEKTAPRSRSMSLGWSQQERQAAAEVERQPEAEVERQPDAEAERQPEVLPPSPKSDRVRLDEDITAVITSAHAGDVDAQFQLGKAYRDGKGVGQDSEDAVFWFRKSAKNGYAQAQYTLGEVYDTGDLVKKDVEEAIRWHRMAADQGHLQAQINLGCLLEKRDAEEEALQWFRKAAQQGEKNESGYGQSNYGRCLLYGIGGEQNFAEAVKWLKEAVKLNVDNDSALYMLGGCYDNGDGVEQDYVRAFDLYRRAAELNYGMAQYEAGKCYLDGRGVKKQRQKAIEWFEKASENGHEKAAKQLELLKEESQL